MKIILKYEISTGYFEEGKQRIELPVGAKILYLAAQHDRLYFWAELATSSLLEQRVPRTFKVVFTGETWEESPEESYIGTARDFKGLVYHLYEVD